MANVKILVIQDKTAEAADVEACLTGLGYTVCARVSSWPQAMEKAAEMCPDLALIDLGLTGDVTGADVGDRLGSQFDVPVVYLTDHAEESLLQRAKTTNPFGFVLKPFDVRQLHLNIKIALSLYEKEQSYKKTQVKLKEQTNLMETIFECISDGVLAGDENGKCLIYNSSAERIAGLDGSDTELAQRPKTFGLFLPDGVTPFPADELPLTRAVRGESTDGIELFIRNQKRPAGVYVSASGRPLQDDSGTTKGGVVIFRDVTDLREAQIRLKKTADRLQTQTEDMETIFDSLSEGVVVVNAKGEFTIFNPSAKRILGIGMPTVPLDQWSERYGVFYLDKATHVPTDQLPLVLAIQGKATDGMELFIRNEKKPEGVYISFSGRPLPKGKEGYGGGVIVFRDVTQPKMAETKLKETMEELRKQNELMEATFNSISDGIIVVDVEASYRYLNPGAERIVGLGEIGMSPDEWAQAYGVFYPDRKTPVETEDLPLIRAMSHGESTDEETLFLRNKNKPDGVFVRGSARPLLNETGSIRGGVIIFRDVTEQWFAEETLIHAFAQGKLEMVDTVLHNIGNAVNSVMTAAETLHQNLTHNQFVRRFSALANTIKAHRDDWIDYIQHDSQGQKVLPFIIALAEDVVRQNEQMTQTIDRVRGRAKYIADVIINQKAFGNSRPERKCLVLQDAISETIKVLEDSLKRKDIKVNVDCKNAPKEIWIQESQLHQMLVNLIKNAIEAIEGLATFSGIKEQPRIQIRAYVEGKFLNLDVSDNGIGIGTKNSKLLFAPGYTTKKSGSGFGLHSIANFVMGSGGQIHPFSNGIGQGATMRVMLRLSSITPLSKKSKSRFSKTRQ